MAYTTLMPTDVLAAHFGDPSWAVVDCRFTLADEAWGEREYLARHIPGAAYAHLDRDLSGPRTFRNGRHPLPDVSTLRRAVGRLGIANGMQVVAYDQDSGMFASRLWWLLRWLGHDTVAVLDGGVARWLAEGRQTSSGEEHRAAREFAGIARTDMVVGADGVQARMAQADWRLVDARTPERYRGDSEPIDRVAGHIPGAINHCFQWNLDEQGRFRPPEGLRTRFRDTIGDVAPEHIICYCGSGVTACHDLLALEHAGVRGAKLYPGSWSEWSSDPSRAVERS
ncbi:MAG: 3-mercaptopyruvate sulfurtransferase [Acidobacteria bacterium RIFCSPLOWO2_12_FULL_65_11]|nr:MAG: 3-mercaptopyruvate sulfurtransferase [Acidobacteria bacterium RIFCSPLOWO2_02_FULL_64_15]OFW32729.1 MAG: 3-mercaptopyruvate sulfurtransferase [Acidobacteria bacterium RIFCSPLOWO2_12_FULL_65_11]